MDYDMLCLRAALIRLTREFFDTRGYLETITPVLSPALIPESCLEVFETALLPPRGSRRLRPAPYYLVPSPEIWMKKLIARHRRPLYQIAPSFRNCESTGRTHSPEFLMLEYYTMDADYMDSLALTEAFFDELTGRGKQALLRFQSEEALAALRPPFIRLSMEEAFRRFAGFSLRAAFEHGGLRDEAARLGLEAAPELPDADVYNLIFIHAVEPRLPPEKPVFLLDYPEAVPCLARRKPGGERERWELYARGLELANCYSEETDAEAARLYIESEEKAKRRTAAVPHPADAGFCALFTQNGGFPRCSGVALGFDRLIMALTGAQSIDAALPFPYPPS